METRNVQREFYTIPEVVEILGLSESTIRRRIKDKSIPAFRPGQGKAIRIHRSVIEKLGQSSCNDNLSSDSSSQTRLSGPEPKWKREIL